MWIARDKNGALMLYVSKPIRIDHKFWDVSNDVDLYSSYYMELKSDSFPNLKWEDKPIEVELVSKKFMDEWREKNKSEVNLMEE